MRKKIILTIIFVIVVFFISNIEPNNKDLNTLQNFDMENVDSISDPILTFDVLDYIEESEKIVEIDKGKKIVISFAGDCTFGRSKEAYYAHSFDEIYDKNDASYFFSNVYDLLKDDSLTIVNLEGTLTDSDTPVEKEFAFKGVPKYAEILKKGSVEAVTIANNHTYDYGEKGYIDTQESLKNYDIEYFGNNRTVMYEVDGIKIGLIGVQTYVDSSYVRGIIEKNHQKLVNEGADITIIYFHWGDELSYTPYEYQKELARFSIDIGIEMVVGAHPHVIQPLEIYKGHTIAYSMGNFSFGGNVNPRDKDSFILQQTLIFDNKEIISRQQQTIPIKISSVDNVNDYKPTPINYYDNQREYQTILDKLKIYY